MSEATITTADGNDGRKRLIVGLGSHAVDFEFESIDELRSMILITGETDEVSMCNVLAEMIASECKTIQDVVKEARRHDRANCDTNKGRKNRVNMSSLVQKGS